MGCWPNRIVSRCPHWIPPHRCDFLTHFSLASGCLTELQNTSPSNKGNNDSNNSSRRKKDSCNQSGRKLGHWGWELGVRGNAATDRKVDWVWKDFLGLYTRGLKNIPPEAICQLTFLRWLHCQHKRQRVLKTKTAHTREIHSYTAR